MSTARIKLPPKLLPVFSGEAMFRGAFGGRGSAKTRSFATMTAVRALMWAQEGRSGLILCVREFMNSLDESSLAEVRAAIAAEPWLADAFEVGEKFVRTRDRRVEYKFAGMRRNIDSIKSKARILLMWADEAEPISETAWHTSINTVREEGSEIWATWNPKTKKSATHKRFRVNPPDGAKIVELNWRDNPFFPENLNIKRLADLKARPEAYPHIWEGDFVKALEGAYFAGLLTAAKAEGRIGKVTADPLLPLKAFIDIGGAGATADAFTIWIVQFVGQEIRVLDYYESVGQVLAFHVAWLRSKGYQNATIYLPHDGVNANNITGKRYEDHLREAGLNVEPPVANQGKGAASMRIEAVRRLGSKMWFNDEPTESGRDALGWYHEKRSDDDRNIGLGPDHDWSSHAADAFGLMAICYEEPGRNANFGREIKYPRQGYA